ncbi:hypothetical protein JNW87_06975 [Micromonospora sp. ATA51]|nr:hypothetical protein [Micromonospora sp. ATA51]MBM0225339.1 hypothetical protein [Micromonospora sp. ATA51]
MEPTMVRQLWQLIEPVHALVYYAPELTEEAATLGLATDERWPGYFALRSAPLGAAGPELVTATYYSFSPRMVAEYVPAVWSVADPAKVLDARLSGMDRTLRALLGDRVDSPELTEAAALARRAAQAADLAGRPLAAANADLPWPDAPHLALWQAATILREHRGDGHVAALLTAGLDPTEALVSFAAVGAAPVEVFAAGAGPTRSGPPPGTGSPRGAWWTPPGWRPTPATGCATTWNGVRTTWRRHPGGRSARRSAGSRSSWPR